MGNRSTFKTNEEVPRSGIYRVLHTEHSIRDIRNAFAHTREPITLKSAGIKQKAKGLEYIDKFGPLSRRLSERDRFISACEFCLGGITAIASDERRLKSPKPGRKSSRKAS